MSDGLFGTADGRVDLPEVVEEDGAMKPVPFLAKPGREADEARTAELDRLGVPSLKMADHGQAVAIENDSKLAGLFRQIGFLQLREPILEKAFGLLEVLLGEISGIEH